MTGYRLLLEHEIVGAWRTYRIAAICLLFVLIGVAAPVVLRFGTDLVTQIAPPDPELGFDEVGVGDVVEALLGLLTRFGAIAAVLLAMGSVAGERERGTMAFTLSKPVGRVAYIWSKFVAMAMILGVGTLLAVLAGWLYTSLLFDMQARMPWLQLAILAWLYLLVPTALTLLASALAPSSMGAAALALGALLVLAIASTVPTLDRWLPNGLIELARAAALRDDSVDLDAGRTIGVTVAFVATPLVLTWLRLRRLDVPPTDR